MKAEEYIYNLKKYLNLHDFPICETVDDCLILEENVEIPDNGNKKQKKYTVCLKSVGNVICIKLDRSKKQTKLYYFLKYTKKMPWSKCCDFLIFKPYRNAIHVFCIEFKSSYPAAIKDSVEQLVSIENFCKSLQKIIKYYTKNTQSYHIKKFVFSNNENPSGILTNDGKFLKEDNTVRHYFYDVVNNMKLSELDNKGVRV